MRRQKWWIAGAAVAGLVAAVMLGAWFLRDDSSKAEPPVQFHDVSSGTAATPVEFQTVAAAAGEASRKAGFSLNVPAYLPKAFAVTDISVSPKPPAPSTSTLSRMSLAIKGGNATLTFLAVNSPFTFEGDDAAHIISSPAKGANIYKVAGAEIVDYTLLTPTRGYVLTARSSDLSEAEAVKVLSSLPMD